MTVKTAAQLKANFQGQDPQDFVADLVDTAEDLPTATTSVSGVVELATDAEAITGTDTARAVTPHALAAAVPAASETAVGKVELATTAETVAVTDYTRAVTPRGLGGALAKLFLISFTGHNGAGACTANGVAVGDVIYAVAGLTDVGAADASFEEVVTVVNQIQQASASDLSLKNFVALVYRPS